MAVVRYLFALLVGVIIGAAGMAYLVESDAGNLLVRRTDVVQDLERRLDGVEQQRNLLAKQLEDVVARAGRMEQAFTELEHRFRAMSDDRASPSPTPPPTEPPSH